MTKQRRFKRRLGYRIKDRDKTSLQLTYGPPKDAAESKWFLFLRHPIIVVVTTFILTCILGGYFTFLLNRKLKEFELYKTSQQVELEHKRLAKQRECDLAREAREKEQEFVRAKDQLRFERDRNFSLELSKMRMARVVELWEKIDNFEANSTILARKLYSKQTSATNYVYLRVRLYNELTDNNPDFMELISFVNKSRFLIGDELYNKYMEYIKTSVNTIIDIAKPRTLKPFAEPKVTVTKNWTKTEYYDFADFSEQAQASTVLRKQRDELREDFLRLRDQVKDE